MIGVAATPARATALQVDLELVLAVDASASVDEREFRLQMGGIAAAFRSPAVQSAIASGGHGRVAVALMLWADGTLRKQVGEWHLVDGPAGAEAFAAAVEAMPRRVTGGTGIGDGLADALAMLGRNRFVAARAVVDVSGDGRETPPREELVVLLPQARAMADALGITVNGLAILSDDPALADWYRSHVITGRGSFVMTAEDFADFERAIREKLVREIAVRIGAPPAPLPPRWMANVLSR